MKIEDILEDFDTNDDWSPPRRPMALNDIQSVITPQELYMFKLIASGKLTDDKYVQLTEPMHQAMDQLLSYGLIDNGHELTQKGELSKPILMKLQSKASRDASDRAGKTKNKSIDTRDVPVDNEDGDLGLDLDLEDDNDDYNFNR